MARRRPLGLRSSIFHDYECSGRWSLARQSRRHHTVPPTDARRLRPRLFQELKIAPNILQPRLCLALTSLLTPLLPRSLLPWQNFPRIFRGFSPSEVRILLTLLANRV